MPVFRVPKHKDFTVMSNYHLRDRELSLKAKGMLSLMLSLPDNWNYTLAGLESICQEGMSSIRSVIKELETHGYLRRERTRNEKGHLMLSEYTILEKAIPPELVIEANDEDEIFSEPAGSDYARLEANQPAYKGYGQPETYQAAQKNCQQMAACQSTQGNYRQVETAQPMQKNAAQMMAFQPVHDNCVSASQPICDFQTLDNRTLGFPTLENPTQENRTQLNTYSSNTEKSNTHESITHSINQSGACTMEEVMFYTSLIKQNIGYGPLSEQYGEERLDEIVQIVLGAVCSSRAHICIKGDYYPKEAVKSQLLKLKSTHVQDVLNTVDSRSQKIHHVQPYLLSCLYTSTLTLENQTIADVKHDLYGGYDYDFTL